MGFVAEIDEESKAAGALPETGSGEYLPLTPGKYQARVTKVDGVADFGGTGPNGKKKVVKIRVDILENSPNGAKRVFFPRIPLFTKFAPKDGQPAKPASAFMGFWRDAIGWPEERLLAGDMPGENDILGKQITITLGAPKAPDQYNPLGFNEVAFFGPAGDINATPTAPVTAPWLTPDGKLNPAWSGAPQQGAAPAAQQPSAAEVWGTPTPAATAPQGDVWAPAAADVAYAQQSA